MDLSSKRLKLKKRVTEAATFKFESGWIFPNPLVPNFCYWCGLVSHDDHDCEKWLGSKGTLQKEDQQYKEWLRAENDFSTRRTSISVPRSRQNFPGPNQRKDNYPKPRPEGDTREGRKNVTRPSKMTQAVAVPKKLGPDWNLSHKESLNENVMIPDFEETLQKIDEELCVNPIVEDAVSKPIIGHESFEFQLVWKSTPLTDGAQLERTEDKAHSFKPTTLAETMGSPKAEKKSKVSRPKPKEQGMWIRYT